MVKHMNEFIWLIALATLIASVSQVLLKKSAQIEHDSFIGEYLNPLVVIGYILMFGSTILGVVAYHMGIEYKNGVMLESMGFVLVLIFSRIFFKEKITMRKLLGNILILLGMAVFYL